MNQIALDFIKARESCRLQAYQDSGGTWTIGWGSTGNGITEGTVWTQAQADTDLQKRVTNVETVVSMKTSAVKLSVQQAAACISLAYNIGLGAFGGSTLLAKILERDWMGAAKEFPKWDRVGTAEVKGLLKRRFYEGALFLEGS